jgi:hypothetical protein
MASRLKGVRNLRTLSGRIGQVAVPYRAYMQITCLEMEKARRNSERQNASRLIAEIEARLLEIEAEKVRILESLSEADSAGHAGIAGQSQVRGKGSFKLRY